MEAKSDFERRKYVNLSPEDFERLAHRTKTLLWDEIYADVGKWGVRQGLSIVAKGLWQILLVALGIAVAIWSASWTGLKDHLR